MPWKESVIVDERMKFIGRLIEGEKMFGDGIWLVSFMKYDLGYFDEEATKLEPLEYPFAAEIV